MQVEPMYSIWIIPPLKDKQTPISFLPTSIFQLPPKSISHLIPSPYFHHQVPFGPPQLQPFLRKPFLHINSFKSKLHILILIMDCGKFLLISVMRIEEYIKTVHSVFTQWMIFLYYHNYCCQMI